MSRDIPGEAFFEGLYRDEHHNVVNAPGNGAAPDNVVRDRFPAKVPSAEPMFTVRTAREIAELPDPPESDLLLGPLVIRGARTIIVADTGHGKTTLGLQFAHAILTGDCALGHTGIGAGPVLVLDLEQGIRSIKRALRDAKLDTRDDVLYIAVPDGLTLDSNEKERAELERIIGEHKPVAMMVDPYYKAHRGDQNEERAVVDLMRYLDKLRAVHGFALFMPAHPRKNASTNGARKLTLDDVSGSGAVTRGAEVVIALERLSHGYARLRILKDRDGDLTVGEEWPLVFNRDDGFRLDPKNEQTAEELEQRILDDEGGWRTVKEWRKLLEIRERDAKALLDKLVETERVEFAKGPAGRSPQAHCYRSAPESPEHPGAPRSTSPVKEGAPTAPTSIEDVEQGAVDDCSQTSGALLDGADDDIPF